MVRIASLIFGALALLFVAAPASAQSGCPYIAPSAVLTAGQWQYCWSQKLDNLGYVPLNPAAVVGVAPITVTPSAGTVQIGCPTCGSGGGGGRTILNAPTTYYANASTGNDASPCTISSQCQTAQRLINLQTGIDNQGYAVTLQLADGNYPAGVVCSSPFVGGGTVTLQGNTTTWTNVVLNSSLASNNAVQAATGCVISVVGMQVKGVAGQDTVMAISGGQITLNKIDFTATVGGTQVAARQTGSRIVKSQGAFTISGGALFHEVFTNNANILEGNATTTFTASVTYTDAYIGAKFGASANIQGNTYNLGAFTVTGPQYDVQTNSVLNANGGCSLLPGSSAGTTATGGQCN